MIREAIAMLVDGTNLTEEQAETVMSEIMDGQATDAQIASYVTALRMKGETLSEVCGSARAMRARAASITVHSPSVVDTCGTGGDGAQTFNISTTVAFVVAGAGMTVAKHGNRAVSSQSGSADVLKQLGACIDLSPANVETCINQTGIGFLFAPVFHSAMAKVAGPRRELGIRTTFNILGPLTNPAGATSQVLGVYDEALTDLMANALLRLGSKHSFVVHGMDGLDEITLTDRSKISEGKDGTIQSYYVKPEDFGLSCCAPVELRGGDADENASILTQILEGQPGPRRDIVLLNAAPAIVAGGNAKTLPEGLTVAQDSIDSGRAKAKLDQLVSTSQKLKSAH
ncbi:MAG TPA: anthranilate phosphoribosyltransferase [Nitrospirales bacterium]|nr:anthranilate phosphoribosyltransferase [Nitrospirales bacterium]HIO22135.1 anthranilate phosphoribosyltransferase [Nitrospirales bacterium]